MKQSHRHYNFGTFEERLEHFCLLFELDPPEIEYEDGDIALNSPLMDWLTENTANMDWLFAGCPSAMLQRWVEKERSVRDFNRINKELEPQVQEGMRAMLTAVVNHDLPLEPAIEIFQGVVEKWRGEKAFD